MDPASARRGLLLFGACVLFGSGLCEGAMIHAGGPIASHPFLALANMWIPGVACVLTRLLRREGFRDVSFRFSSRSLGVAWLFPVAVGALAYGLAWSTGLASFAARPMAALGMQNAPIAARFIAHLGVSLTLGTLLSAISAAGEELGWRGYMVQRLIEAKVPHPLLLSGMVWSTWHLPLILSGQYASGPRPLLSAVLFFVSTVAGGLVAGRARLESGSLWPAVVFHSAWNSCIQSTFDGHTAGASESFTDNPWVGESGVLVVVASVLLVLVWFRRPWIARFTPRGDVARTFDLRSV